MDTLVWYVAFGSNMDPDRLSCYLEGGRPEGARREYRGARDPSPPRAAEPVRIPHHLRFCGRSSVWGGGVAFVEPVADPAAATPAVAWLITTEQLSDLVAQENAGNAPGPALGHLPGPGRSSVLATGWYDTLVGVEPPHRGAGASGAVVLTATELPAAHLPSVGYLDLLRAGRRRWFGEAEVAELDAVRTVD
jgi:hypothetical protein